MSQWQSDRCVVSASAAVGMVVDAEAAEADADDSFGDSFSEHHNQEESSHAVILACVRDFCERSLCACNVCMGCISCLQIHAACICCEAPMLLPIRLCLLLRLHTKQLKFTSGYCVRK